MTRGVNNGGGSVLDNYSPTFRHGLASVKLGARPSVEHQHQPSPTAITAITATTTRIFPPHLPSHPRIPQERSSWRTAWKASSRRPRSPKPRALSRRPLLVSSRRGCATCPLPPNAPVPTARHRGRSARCVPAISSPPRLPRASIYTSVLTRRL